MWSDHCLPLRLCLLHHLQGADLQLLLPSLTPPDGREQPHLLWHVSKTHTSPEVLTNNPLRADRGYGRF